MTSPSSDQRAALSDRAMTLAGKRAFIFDYDGTLVRGDVLIPGTVEALEWLRLKGYDLAVVTNNSFLHTSELHQLLVRHGFPVAAANVHTAVSVAADEAVRRAPRRRVVCAGSAGLAAALEGRGLTLVTSDADVVVTGMDRDLTYDKLTLAVEAVLAGAVFVAVNMDRLLVDPDRIGPGGGVVAAAVQYATGRAPDVVAGKPSTHTCSSRRSPVWTERPRRRASSAIIWLVTSPQAATWGWPPSWSPLACPAVGPPRSTARAPTSSWRRPPTCAPS